LSGKVKLAIAPLGTCSGCDLALIDIGEQFLELAELAEIVFWPTAADFKLEDVEALGNNEIDITIHHGSIRSEENKKILELLAKKSKIMIAFGSCSNFGGIPGLCNLFDIKPEQKQESEDKGNKLTLPKICIQGYLLTDITDVDYFVPGCPPVDEQIEELIKIIKNYKENKELPPKGLVLAGDKALCDECPREKPDRIIIDKFKRVHEVKNINDEECFLSQGIICMGPATRSGCGARCIKGNMPCRGCFGPPPNVRDQGAKMISALASVLYADKEIEVGEERLKEIMDTIVDPVGLFYRFTLPSSTINKRVKKGDLDDR